MSKRRMHDSRMWESEKFAQLPPMARLLMVALIDVSDDQGRFRAHPAWLRSQVFPYDDVTLADVRGWLDAISKNETVLVYDADGQRYGQLVNWWKYQRPPFATASAYPAPDGWMDRIRVTFSGGKDRRILTHNWTNLDGTLVPDTCNAQGEHLFQTPIPNTYSEQATEHLDDKNKNKDKDKKKDKDNDSTPPLDSVQARHSHMMKSVGLTANYDGQPAKYRKWFEGVAMERSPGDFDKAVALMAADYRGDKMDGMSVWQRTEHYLKNGVETSNGALFEVYS